MAPACHASPMAAAAPVPAHRWLKPLMSLRPLSLRPEPNALQRLLLRPQLQPWPLLLRPRLLPWHLFLRSQFLLGLPPPRDGRRLHRWGSGPPNAPVLHLLGGDASRVPGLSPKYFWEGALQGIHLGGDLQGQHDRGVLTLDGTGRALEWAPCCFLPPRHRLHFVLAWRPGLKGGLL